MRSLERTVEEVLLPAVETLAADGGRPRARLRLALGASWLAAATRVSPAATRDEGIVIFDASTTCDIESLYVQALELALRRRGLRTLTISVALDPARMARALHARRAARGRPRRPRAPTSTRSAASSSARAASAATSSRSATSAARCPTAAPAR